MDRRRSLLKIAALRSERERQAGVDCTKGYFQSRDAGLLFEGPRTLECLFTYVPSNVMQVIAGFGTSMMEISVISSVIRFYCGGAYKSTVVVSGDNYLVDIAYDGTTAICYLNGAEIARFTVTGYKVTDFFRTGSKTYIPKGSLVFCRHYNYALSAEEVAAHYNGGDPAGYVLPKLYRQFGPNIELTADTFEFNIDSPEYQIVIPSRQYSYDCIYRIDYVVDEWDFQPERYNIVGFNGVAGASIIAGNYLWYTPQQAKIGEVQSCFVKMPMGQSAGVWCFAGEVRSDTTARHLKVTIKGITPVGCIAEYLPQNIRIAQKRDFPQVVFPVAKYTPSSGVFDLNSSSATIIKNDQPQANGFSGAYTRFDAITSISLYCAYISDFIKKQAPLKITFEYRSNRILYSSNITASPAASDAVAIDVNEGDAKIASVSCYVGATAFIFSASDPEAWLEMRVLSIEVAEGVALSWLDSAKQLPLNDEYLPPLLQSDGGYDLTANGTPEIIYQPTLISVYQ